MLRSGRNLASVEGTLEAAQKRDEVGFPGRAHVDVEPLVVEVNDVLEGGSEAVMEVRRARPRPSRSDP